MFDTDDQLIAAADALHAKVSGAQRELLHVIATLDHRDAWQDSGARDLPHWLGMRHLVVEGPPVDRSVARPRAAPRLSRAFASGALGIDKVVELCRFATPETEAQLIRWAKEVSCATIRRRGDVAARTTAEEIADAERSRSLTWWYADEGRRLGLEAELPAAQGEVVVRALERMADQVPDMPGEAGSAYADARRADALVALCSARIAADPDPDRASVVVHAPLGALMNSTGGCGSGSGSSVPGQTLERLLCTARVLTQVEDEAGTLSFSAG
jgi:hypothetical protein